MHIRFFLTANLDYGLDGSLLDGGGFLEAVGVDTTDQVLAQAHAVKCRDDLQTRE